jgi:hypothetical protein
VPEHKPSSSASPLSRPISPPTAALGPLAPPETSPDLPSRSSRSKPVIPLPPSSSPSPSTGSVIRAADPDHLVLRPRKMRSGQRFSYLALEPEVNPHAQRRLPRAHPPQTNPISFPWIRRPSSKRLSNSSPATATSKKAWAWMALTGRRPALDLL